MHTYGGSIFDLMCEKKIRFSIALGRLSVEMCEWSKYIPPGKQENADSLAHIIRNSIIGKLSESPYLHHILSFHICFVWEPIDCLESIWVVVYLCAYAGKLHRYKCVRCVQLIWYWIFPFHLRHWQEKGVHFDIRFDSLIPNIIIRYIDYGAVMLF